jgi:hypothetical protein
VDALPNTECGVEDGRNIIEIGPTAYQIVKQIEINNFAEDSRRGFEDVQIPSRPRQNFSRQRKVAQITK